MKKLLLATLCVLSMGTATSWADTATLNGKEYEINTLIDREIGPGVRYMRLRIPSFPLNVNLLMMDMNNPYNRAETTQANDRLYGTESLVTAAKRQTTKEKRVLAGSNANFWCVSTQPPYSDRLIGVTYNGNLRNGKIITETNCMNDQWNGGTKHTGIVGITPDKKVYSNNNFTWSGTFSNEKIGDVAIMQVNKVADENANCIYNSYFGTGKQFFTETKTYTESDGKYHYVTVTGDATEVYLSLNEGQEWSAGNPIQFTVKEIKSAPATNGKLGSYDLAIVGRGTQREALEKLAPGDIVTVKYTWTNNNGTNITFENLVGGNAQVMKNGEYTTYNDSESYNSQTYSRTGMGCSADRKTLYIIVIDKATSAKYGASAGCNTKVMCDIAKHYGCVYMTNFDAGGSAEMLVDGAIINTTTESTPRAVANGMFLYSIAPEDPVITRLEFDEYTLKAPPYSTYRPVIIGYNQYGDIVDKDVQGITLSCDAALGTCEGNELSVGGTPGTFQLTASLGDVKVTKDITVLDAPIAIRIKDLLIDGSHPYTLEVTATIGDNVYKYDSSKIAWSVADPDVLTVDATGTIIVNKIGKTTITGVIGDVTDQCNVTVEIAESAAISHNKWSDYTAKGSSGLTNVAIDENGNISLTYGAPRDPYIQLAGTGQFYSIPDRLAIEFTSTIPLAKIGADVRTPIETRTNMVYALPANGTAFATNEKQTAYIDIAEFCDPKDLINYPVSYNYVRFMTTKDAANKGNHTLTINDIRAEYDHFSAVETISVDGANGTTPTITVYPTVAEGGQTISVTATSAIENVTLYSMSGAKVAQTGATGSAIAHITAPAGRGMYIMAVATASGIATTKIIVK